MQESIAFFMRVQCRRKGSSHSLFHLLMSFLLLIIIKNWYSKKNCCLLFQIACNIKTSIPISMQFYRIMYPCWFYRLTDIGRIWSWNVTLGAKIVFPETRFNLVMWCTGNQKVRFKITSIIVSIMSPKKLSRHDWLTVITTTVFLR